MPFRKKKAHNTNHEKSEHTDTVIQDSAVCEGNEVIDQEMETVTDTGEKDIGELNMEEFMLLKQQHDEARQKLSEYEELLKRQQAEFDNYRKRIIRERQESAKFAAFPVLQDLLPTLDNFERALSIEVADPAQQSFIDGFRMVHQDLLELMKKYQVQEIHGEGSEFDPTLHQAVALEQESQVEVDTVTEVFQKGYEMCGKVLREARVKIAKAAAGPDPETEDEQIDTADTDQAENSSAPKN